MQKMITLQSKILDMKNVRKQLQTVQRKVMKDDGWLDPAIQKMQTKMELLNYNERNGYSESQSFSASSVLPSVDVGEGGSGGRSSCIRYFSLIHGLTSSYCEDVCGAGGKRERERVRELHVHQFAVDKLQSKSLAYFI